MCMVDPTVTKEDVDALTDDCLRLRAIWHHYQTLFEYSQLRRELLDNVAGTFFRDINLILIGQMILQICRITDPIQMRGRKSNRQNPDCTLRFFERTGQVGEARMAQRAHA